jgi:hypothetical protein
MMLGFDMNSESCKSCAATQLVVNKLQVPRKGALSQVIHVAIAPHSAGAMSVTIPFGEIRAWEICAWALISQGVASAHAIVSGEGRDYAICPALNTGENNLDVRRHWRGR